MALGNFVDREDEGREEPGVLALKSTGGNFDWVVVGAGFEDDIRKDAGGSLSAVSVGCCSSKLECRDG